MINSTAYYNDFWNEMRGKQAVTDNLYNNRDRKSTRLNSSHANESRMPSSA